MIDAQGEGHTMFDRIRSLLSRLSGRGAKPRAPRPSLSPVSVTFDDWGVRLSESGQTQGEVAWADVHLVAICIEDAYLPFPYWYVGTPGSLLRIPNDAVGGSALFFDGLAKHLPGYHTDATYRTIATASCAMEGIFFVWTGGEGPTTLADTPSS